MKAKIYFSNDYQYYFVLVGLNRKVIAVSELYKQKGSAKKTLSRYFPQFTIEDQTK